MLIKKYYYLAVALILTTGCLTTGITKVPYNKELSKYVNNVVIIPTTKQPEMSVNIRSEDEIVSSLMAAPVLLAGPSSIPQMLIMHLNFLGERKNTARLINSLMFDLDVGEAVSKKLNTKLQLCTYFHIVPQESIGVDKAVWNLLEKKDKALKDYQQLGKEMGVDTIVEVNVLSYGLKQLGFFSAPYATIKIDVKMTTASEGVVLWRDVIEAKSKVDVDLSDVHALEYDEVKALKEEFEYVADVVSEECIKKLGFDTRYTYLLDKRFLKNAQHNIDLANKLEQLNNLRYNTLITDTDYDEKKQDLIEKAKVRKTKKVNHSTAQNTTEEDKRSAKKHVGKRTVKPQDKTRSGRPPLPRRD